MTLVLVLYKFKKVVTSKLNRFCLMKTVLIFKKTKPKHSGGGGKKWFS